MSKRAKGLSASSKAVDPTLDALFSASAGPVQAPPKSRYGTLLEKKVQDAPPPAKVALKDDDEEGNDDVLSEISEELDYEDDEDENDEDDAQEGSDAGEETSEAEGADASMVDVPVELDDVIKATEGEKSKRDRKRKRKDEHDDLEGKYLSKFAEDDEPIGKRPKSDAPEAGAEDDEDSNDDEESKVPVHESLAKDADTSDIEKAARTVFLANVSTEAISSKADKKTLMAHLASVLDKDASPPQSIESIRFRSVAFGGGSLPKRAAYITKTLMEATTKSANAYVVYSTTVAARTAATKLNGTEVLGRHIRVDSVAHPSPTDHRRCVFVGNLGFVDDETVINRNADGETTEKKRNKVPSDIEEGLWRTFGKVGKVESVRVIRDPKTRVGKGFAYVQFYDGNDVEAALLLNEKKFPPMLPRVLRVTRAKDPRKTLLAQERSKSKNSAVNGPVKSTKHKPKATPEQQSMAGRTGKLLGRSAAAQQRHGKRPFKADAPDAHALLKTPEQVVFEGRRASSNDATPRDLKNKKSKGKSGRPQNRGAKRAAEWKKKS
ncbi:Nucleolar protein 12 [Neonectria ditissima]|uniref:Nucleolar protein 12 n=1 Tax=Neonectria ditissima TaxID=78410 RepID=A0A0N8H770_9HYPO|nr:Nucleolar protein 12 [Neonectria ditissima]